MSFNTSCGWGYYNRSVYTYRTGVFNRTCTWGSSYIYMDYDSAVGVTAGAYIPGTWVHCQTGPLNCYPTTIY